MKKTSILFSWILIAIVWLIVNFLTLHYPGNIFDRQLHNPIDTAHLIPTNGTTPPTMNKNRWEITPLPDDWLVSGRDTFQMGYLLRFTPNLNESHQEPWSVYLSHITHNAAVYLNGLWLGQSGPFSNPVSRHHNRPQLFEFSSHLLIEGENELFIRVKSAYRDYGLLGNVYVGPATQLRPAYEFKYFIRITLVQWLSIVMVLMAVTVLVFYMARPQDAIYGIFSAELFLWSAHNLNLFVHNIPVPERLWEAMTMATLGWTVVLMVFFNHRFIGQPIRLVERSMLVFASLGIGLYFLPTVEQVFFLGYKIWDGLLVIFGSYALGYLLRRFWLAPDLDKLLMILSGIPILVFGLHDILVVNGFRPRTEGLIIQYSALPALLVFSWFIIKRFIRSINQSEDLSRNLERKVAEREKEIAQQFQQLKNLEQETLLSRERERIMRDMHDGIGSQLVSLVSALYSEKDPKLQQVREKIQDSLEDLKLVIDSLDPGLNNIATLLGSLRHRLEDNLNKSHITLQWDVDLLPEKAETSPQQNLHILRIIQEAISNAIKHAQCNSIVLKLYFEQCHNAEGEFSRDNVIIELKDNGQGFDLSDTLSLGHHGIKNMQQRAREIEGHLEIQSDSEGSRIKLIVPVKALH